MKKSDNYCFYFGDLHFHTHYSDNRDRASIEEMILEGVKWGLSIFGTADHNHNLDTEKWKQTLEETETLKKKYPDFLLINNCEITFLLGHLNVLIPEHIEGTIEEGYRYLYLDPNALKIINHPYAFNDEWYRRILPDAIGVEVINGSVFSQAKEKGYRIHSAIDIPSVQVYVTYLALELPVAAIGASDAHCKAEMGYGVTGFWLANKPDSQSVLEAIRACRTFAATRYDLIIECSLNESKNAISWNIDWKKKNSPSNNDFTVEIYHGDQKIKTTHGDGKISVEKEGLYWIAVFDEHDIAISSPINVRGKYHTEKNTSRCASSPFSYPLLTSPIKGEELMGNSQPIKGEELHKKNLLKGAIQCIRADLTWLSMKKGHLSQPISEVFSQNGEIQVISGAEHPQIFDTNNTEVPYDVIKRGSPRVIIDKACDARGFDEFYLWLERNEIHEYVFAKIIYQKVDQTFFFKGHLLPKKMVHRKDIARQHRNEIKKIRKLVDTHTKFKVHVSTFPSTVIKIHLNSCNLPYRIFDDFTGFISVFSYIEEDVECPIHILDRLKGIRYDDMKPLQEKIYQIFV